MVKDCVVCKKTYKSTCKALKKCALCKARYWSTECQEIDWPQHRLVRVKKAGKHVKPNQLQRECQRFAVRALQCRQQGNRAVINE